MAGNSVTVVIRAKDEATKPVGNVEGKVDDLGDAFGRMSSKASKAMDIDTKGINGKLDGVADASGDAERGLIGMADIAGFAAEQMGLNIGPVQDLARGYADLSGGLEGVLAVGPKAVAALGKLPATMAASAASVWSFVTAETARAAATIAANLPLIAVIATLAILAAGVVLVVRHWDDLVAKFPVLGTIAEGVKSALGGLMGVFDDIVGAGQKVLDFVTGNWQTIAVVLSGPFLPLVVLATDMFGIRSAIQGAITGALTWIENNWKTIATIISGPFLPLVILATDAFGVRSGIEGAFSNAKTFVSARIDEIVGFVTGLPGRITASVGAIKTAAMDIGGAIKDGIVEGLKGFGEHVAEIATEIQNALRDAVNSSLRWLNQNVKVSIPGFDPPGPGSIPGFDWNFPLVQLAKGGVINRPTLALIGESGPEAVVPLGRGGGGLGGDVNVSVTVHGSVWTTHDLLDEIDKHIHHQIRSGSWGQALRQNLNLR